jgi:hypothetical protein
MPKASSLPELRRAALANVELTLLGLEENSLALACNRTGCEATGKQKLPAHVTSFASAEGGCRIVGVTDFRQAPEAMNILL